MARLRLLSALAMACVLVAAMAPGRAAASGTQESMFQDDNELVYASPNHVEQVLTELAALGVERIRVSVIWALVAPDPLSTTRPSFDATNPAAYPDGAWDRYDVLVTDAHALGLSIDFDVTSPAPYWATQRAPATIDTKFNKNFYPSAVQFGQFVQAVATRYSGTYVPEAPTAPPPPPPATLLGLPLPPSLGGTTTTTTTPTPAAPAPLPRVNYWEIWNEPNEAGWLSPQWRRGPPLPVAPAQAHGHHRGHKRSTINWVEESPILYRRILDQSWSALAATGHGSDTILIGDTSAKGSVLHGILPAMPPMIFLRALYCVGNKFRPLTGARAAERDCPTNGNASTFAAQHPALVGATGYAHHPYSFKFAPNVPSTSPTWATMADLARFESALQRIFATYGRSRPAGVPLYLTEYGYKSNPPNPYVQITQTQQAAYINEGEYMAWLDPYVRTLAQFELVDAGPQAGKPIDSPAYWGTFQTGLVNLNGTPKPAYYAYRIPIWVPRAHPGPEVTVWGQLRPADQTSTQIATIEYAPRGASAFTALQQVQTTGSQGFIYAHIGISRPGWLRLAWPDPTTGVTYHSRVVAIR